MRSIIPFTLAAVVLGTAIGTAHAQAAKPAAKPVRVTYNTFDPGDPYLKVGRNAVVATAAVPDAVTPNPVVPGAVAPGPAPVPAAVAMPGFRRGRHRIERTADRGPWCKSGIVVGTGSGFCIVN